MEAHQDTPIVGIGASAGGVRALQELFESLPAETGAAFVVIVHLDPQARSELAAIIASRTSMPVTQVEDAAKLEANSIYVIPPNRRLHIADHMISALSFEEPRGQRAPIDLFFRSLAEHHDDAFASGIIVIEGERHGERHHLHHRPDCRDHGHSFVSRPPLNRVRTLL